MAARRLAMRKVREILRMKYELGLPHRSIARSLHMSIGTVSEYSNRDGSFSMTSMSQTPRPACSNAGAEECGKSL